MLGAAGRIPGLGMGGLTLSSAGLLAGAGAGLGLMGAFKAGQSGNNFLRASSPAIGAVSGLVGYGALLSMFPALLATGPVGWIAAAGIGATIGILGMFKKRAEDKIVEKIRQVYGIRIDQGFARNPLLPIIKDQFGGDIDLGIRSPIVREMLSVYRMQTGQSSLGAGLGASNNMPRGVNLSGYGGMIYQAPVSVNGGSYGYGGALPSTTPAQPFQGGTAVVAAVEAIARRPLDVRVQIDGRDVQSSVARTNQSSVGRRETSATLTDPLLIFG